MDGGHVETTPGLNFIISESYIRRPAFTIYSGLDLSPQTP